MYVLQKMVKIIIGIGASMLLIVLISFYYLSTYVGTLQPVIEKAFQSQTGYLLHIDSIHFFKKGLLSFSKLELNNLTIQDKDNKRVLAKIESVTLSIKLYQLLFKNLIMRKIEINHVVINDTSDNKKQSIMISLLAIGNKLKDIKAFNSLRLISVENVVKQKNNSKLQPVLKSFTLHIYHFFKSISLEVVDKDNTHFIMGSNYRFLNKNKIQFTGVTINFAEFSPIKLPEVMLTNLEDSLLVNTHIKNIGGSLMINYHLNNDLKHLLTIKGDKIKVIDFLRLFTKTKPPIKSGTLKVDIKLSSTGEGISDILNHLTGKVYLYSSNVVLINKKLSSLGGDIIFSTVRALMPFGKSKQLDKLTCFTLNSPVNQGIINFKDHLAMETKSIVATAKGSMSLVKNSINLTLNLAPRKEIIMSLSSFTNQILIKGRILSPKVSTGSSASSLLKTGANVGAAVATGGLSILAKGLYSIAVQKDYHPCVNISLH